ELVVTVQVPEPSRIAASRDPLDTIPIRYKSVALASASALVMEMHAPKDVPGLTSNIVRGLGSSSMTLEVTGIGVDKGEGIRKGQCGCWRRSRRDPSFPNGGP